MSPNNTSNAGGKINIAAVNSDPITVGSKNTQTKLGSILDRHDKSIDELHQKFSAVDTIIDQKLNNVSEKIDKQLLAFENNISKTEQRINESFDQLEARTDKQGNFMMIVTLGIGVAALTLMVTVGYDYLSSEKPEEQAKIDININNDSFNNVDENELNGLKFRLNGLETRIQRLEQ